MKQNKKILLFLVRLINLSLKFYLQETMIINKHYINLSSINNLRLKFA